jgi:predicted acylesterase/phospholipase RssA
LRAIKFDRLYDEEKPFIFHNAWNLSQQDLVLFANRRRFKHYSQIDAASLCACSALPFIEQTVEIDGDIYCEGALVDTVNFKDLIEDHPDLEEIWISRIVDADQIRPPRDLLDSMANLCEQFAASLGEDDIKLFRYHVQYGNNGKPIWNGTIVEIPVSSDINFKWSRSNLEHGIRDGIVAAEEAYDRYHALANKVKVPKARRHEPVIIKGPDREERMRARKQRPGFEHRLRERLAERADP